MKRYLLAALAGAAAGLLLAPQKGEETRRELKNKLKDQGLDVDELKTPEGREHVAAAIKQRVQDLKHRGGSFLADQVDAEENGAHEVEVRVLDSAPDGAQTRKLEDDEPPAA